MCLNKKERREEKYTNNTTHELQMPNTVMKEMKKKPERSLLKYASAAAAAFLQSLLIIESRKIESTARVSLFMINSTGGRVFIRFAQRAIRLAREFSIYNNDSMRNILKQIIRVLVELLRPFQ